MVADPRPVLIYAPGLDGTGKLFHRQELLLAPYCEVRVLTLPLDDRGDWQAMAQRMLALWPTSGQRVLVCGESFGAGVALMAALSAPERVDGLILINPATAWRRQSLLRWGAQGLRYLPMASFPWAGVGLLPFLAALDRIAPEDCRALLTIMQQVPPATIIHRLGLLDGLDVDERLSLLTCPVLLVAGDQDRLLPSVAEVEFLKTRLPQAQIARLTGGGHALLLETATRLPELLTKFQLL